MKTDSSDSAAVLLEGFQPRRSHVLIAAAAVAALYLFQVTDAWWPTADSALYLGLGKSIASGEGYRFNGEVNNFVTPGLPLILAGLRTALGPGHLAANLLMALCGLGALWLSYLSLARLSDRRTALLATLAAAMSFNFYSNSHRVLTDAPFCLLFWSCLYACLRYFGARGLWLLLAALLSAAAVVIRAPGIVLLGPLAAALLLPERPGPALRKRLSAGAGVLAAACLTTGAFYLLARKAVQGVPPYLARSLARPDMDAIRHVQEFFMGLAQAPGSFAVALTDEGAVAVGLPLLLLAAAGACLLWRDQRTLVPTIVVLYVACLAGLRGSHSIRARYLMPISPMIVYLMLVGLQAAAPWAWRLKGRVLPPAAVHWTGVGLVGVLMAFNAARVLQSSLYYGYLSHFSSRYYQVVSKGRFAELGAVAQVIADHAAPGAVSLADREKTRTLHYLSGRLMASFADRDDEQKTAADAEKIYREFLDAPPQTLITFDTQTGRPAFLERLKALFDDSPVAEGLYKGPRHYRVYRRLAPTSMSAPALQAAQRP